MNADVLTGKKPADKKVKVTHLKKNSSFKSKKMNVGSAMKEVHDNVPKNVVKTGKTGKAKEKMLQAIAFSKAGESKK